MLFESKVWLDATSDLSHRNRQRFEAYIKEHKDAWLTFVKLSFRAINKGQKKWSALGIVYVIRFYENVVRENTTFKINNNHSPFFSRLFALKYPEHSEFFNYREHGEDWEPEEDDEE